jgi:drug/metabolite transporter (DMT)-like permease
MRKGNLVLVAAFSYFTPLLSTLVTALYLAVVPGPAIWTASVLVVAGAVICHLAIVEEPGVARSD